ncbi:MAG: hypothetical protein QXF45_07980 [Candidatus Caldarchaeum sp.]
MIFDIRKFIYVEKSKSPYLKVNRILGEIPERKIKTEQAYNELQKLVTKLNDIQQRRKELTDRELSILLPLERIIGKSHELTESVKQLVASLEKEGLFFQYWNLKKTRRKSRPTSAALPSTKSQEV